MWIFDYTYVHMGRLRLVGSFKLYVSFAEYCLFYKGSFAKETHNLKEPTNRSHPIQDAYVSIMACVCVSYIGGYM